MTRLERWIAHSLPVRFLVRESKAIHLPGFHGLPLYDVVRFVVRQINRHGVNERAAAISFNLLMALPPLLIFLFTLVPYIPFSRGFIDELLRLAQDLTPDLKSYLTVKGFIEDFTRPRGGLLSFGFLLVVFYSSNAMIGIMRSFDRSLHAMHLEEKNFLEFRWTAIKLTTILVGVFIATILVLITQGALLSWLLRQLQTDEYGWIRYLIQALRWIAIYLLFSISIGLIYKHAPSVRKKWKLFSPGTNLATVLIILTTWIFSYWVNQVGAYNKIYGSIGTLLILMLLIFVNSMILLIGFELNVSINHLRAVAEHRQEMEKKESES